MPPSFHAALLFSSVHTLLTLSWPPLQLEASNWWMPDFKGPVLCAQLSHSVTIRALKEFDVGPNPVSKALKLGFHFFHADFSFFQKEATSI